MFSFADAVALIVLGLLYQQANRAKQRESDSEEQQRKHDAMHATIVKAGGLTPEIEELHQQVFRAFAKESFQHWFSSNSFLCGLGGSLLSFIWGFGPWPGLCVCVALSSPRMWGHFIRWWKGVP